MGFSHNRLHNLFKYLYDCQWAQTFWKWGVENEMGANFYLLEAKEWVPEVGVILIIFEVKEWLPEFRVSDFHIFVL